MYVIGCAIYIYSHLPGLSASIGVTRSYSSCPFLCALDIDNEAVLHNTISAMAHDISPPRPTSSIATVNCYSNKQIAMYADTCGPPPHCATLSHVAINSVVGVKLPEDGNNSCSRSRALWRRVKLDVFL